MQAYCNNTALLHDIIARKHPHWRPQMPSQWGQDCESSEDHLDTDMREVYAAGPSKSRRQPIQQDLSLDILKGLRR